MQPWKDFCDQIIANIDECDAAYVMLMNLKHKYYRIYIHSLNVAYCIYYLAKDLGMDESTSSQIALGGLLHDIGKINIPSGILYKTGSLNDSEWEILRKHPVHGITLLATSKYYSFIEESVLYHHERCDGNGYNYGLKNGEIPLSAKLTAICDSFDAMVSSRGYKKILSMEEAKQELIDNKFTQFDGYYVDVFCNIINEVYTACNYADQIKNLETVCLRKDILPDWQYIADRVDNLAVMFIDRNDVIRFCNQQAAVFRGRDKESIIGKSYFSLHKPKRGLFLRKKFSEMRQGNNNGWYRVMSKNNRYIQNQYFPVRNENKDYIGSVFVTTDVNEQETVLRNLEKTIDKLNILGESARLLTSLESLEQIFEKLQILLKKLWKLDYLMLIFEKYKNQNAFVLSSSDMSGKISFKQLKNEYFCDDAAVTVLRNVNDSVRIFRLMNIRRKHKCIIELSINEGHFATNEYEKQLMEAIFGYLYMAIENHLLYVDIEEKSISDQLTGLYNRRYLEKVQNHLILDDSLVFISGDLNNLKFFNDNYGHAAGDELLVGASDAIKASVREQDLVFRIGGDEFLILLVNATEFDAQRVIKRIRKNASLRKFSHPQLVLSLAFGYMMSYKDAQIHEIIASADEKMYADKMASKKIEKLPIPQQKN